MKGTTVVKFGILAFSAALASTFAVVGCSFGPDRYNGPSVCPGTAPPDTVMVPDGECWDGGGLPPDAGTAGGGGDTAGGGGDATAGASAAGTAGTAGASGGSGGAGTAGTGGASAGTGGASAGSGG